MPRRPRIRSKTPKSKNSKTATDTINKSSKTSTNTTKSKSIRSISIPPPPSQTQTQTQTFPILKKASQVKTRIQEAIFPDLLRDWSVADTITSINAFCGTLALFQFHNGPNHFYQGLFLLFLGLICDILDGTIARYRQSTLHIKGAKSPFGKDLDSLADLITFGLAPAFAAFSLAGVDSGWDQFCLGIFVCCGVARLARYNVTSEELMAIVTGDSGLKRENKSISNTKTSRRRDSVPYFEGLPIPAAQSIIMMILYVIHSGVFAGYYDFLENLNAFKEISTTSITNSKSTNYAQSSGPGSVRYELQFFDSFVDILPLRDVVPSIEVLSNMGISIHILSIVFLFLGWLMVSKVKVPKVDLRFLWKGVEEVS